jgi:tRNA A37 threonylcarbamoyladenosine dehydratase
MESWQARTELLLGEDKLKKLQMAHVLVVGAGGVGAYAAEMLCRAGVGELTIADADVVSETNLNRQLVALTGTIGKPKVEVLSQRLLDINPKLKLHTVQQYFLEQEFDALLSFPYSFVVDAIDTLRPKVNLIAKALKRGLPIVSSMGAGGRLDPTKVEVADISKSHHCPLAHMLRKKLHKLGIYDGVAVVFSSERPNSNAIQLCDDEQNKKSMVGTISYLPAVFGCICGSVVVRQLAK